MIPIRDVNPVQSRPVVTYAIIAVNVAVWLFQIALGTDMTAFVTEYGVVPARLLSGKDPVGWLTLLTSMFMHGGWLHVIGNMWFLWVFGDNVEDTLGKVRFVAFYVVCGLAAAASQVLIDPQSPIPMVGASGAIAGVLAAYVVLFPRARVVTLVPLFIFVHFVELPAFVFIFIWFGFQLLSGTLSLGAASMGGTAFFAHIGGFIAGLVIILAVRKQGPPRKRRVYHRRRPGGGGNGAWGVDRHRSQ